MAIKTATAWCSNCQRNVELKYRRFPGSLRGHWLCVTCSWPARDFNKLMKYIQEGE